MLATAIAHAVRYNFAGHPRRNFRKGETAHWPVALSRGALTESINRIAAGQSVPLLRFHDFSNVVGSSREIDFNLIDGPHNLLVSILSPRALAAAKLIAAIHGTVGVSLGLVDVEEYCDRNPITGEPFLRIENATIGELSLVHRGAFEGSELRFC